MGKRNRKKIIHLKNIKIIDIANKGKSLAKMKVELFLLTRRAWGYL